MILNLESWFHCNDTAVPKTIFHLIITSTNQINFFCISYCELEYLSLSSCVMTRHVNPVFVHFFHCFVRRLGYLIMSLGVTTLHITPVMLNASYVEWQRCYCIFGGSRPVLDMSATVNITCWSPVVGVSTDDLNNYCIIPSHRKHFGRRIESVGWMLGEW